MKAKRKIGKTIYKSKKKKKLDDVRVQQETRTRESGNERERVSEAKVTNLKTGKPSYTKVIDERDSKGNYSLRQMQSTPGEGGTYGNVGKGEYISFDKDMNLSSGGKKIKNIDPITLGDMVEASANKFFKNGGKMKAKKMYKGGGKLKGKTITTKKADKKKGLEPMAKKPKGYSEKSKKMGVTTIEERRAERDAQRLGSRYNKGGKVGNLDKKVRPEVGKWYMKQSKEVKAMFDNAYESAYKRGASPAQSRESAIRAVEKKLGKTIKFKYGGKLKKYLKGGQVKLDANKDGKITGQDFKMLRKK